MSAADRLRHAPAAHAALRAACRARRQDGAVRRLRDAGAVSARHPQGAPAHAREGGAVRRLAHGPGVSDRPRSRRRRRARWKRWCRPTSSTSSPGQQRYTQLLNDEGGIIDDLMVTRSACRRRRRQPDAGRQCVAQGGRLRPYRGAAAGRRDAAAGAGARAAGAAGPGREGRDGASSPALRPACRSWRAASGKVGEFDCHISRSGYTGEDGFEISVAAAKAEKLARLLLAQDGVQPIGLGARDSLRLEAGFASTATTSTRPRARSRRGSPGRSRSGAASEGGFPGAERIQDELANGPRRAPRRHQAGRPGAGARGHARSLALLGEPIGMVTSGGFGPSVNGPVAMGYVHGRLRASPARR